MNKKMSKPSVWDRITAYVAGNKLKVAKEAKVLQKEAIKTVGYLYWLHYC